MNLEFGQGQNINFTEVSIASRASIRRQELETTTPHAPDGPSGGCLGDPAPFLLEYISELVDVLWLVRSPPNTSPKVVPQLLNWRQGWGLRWSWESPDSSTLQAILETHT